MNVNDKIALVIGQAHLQRVIAEAQLEAAQAKVADLEARIADLEPKTGDGPEPERVADEGSRLDAGDGDGDGPRPTPIP